MKFLRPIKSQKGNKRRNRLLELNMLDLTPSNPLYKEDVKYPQRLVSGEYWQNIPDLLYYGKQDVQTLLQLQTSHWYALGSTYLCADMTEYIYSNPLIFEHLKEIFENMIVAICRIKRKDFSKIEIPEEKQDKFDHSR